MKSKTGRRTARGMEVASDWKIFELLRNDWNFREY